jgi:hypothetical protein
MCKNARSIWLSALLVASMVQALTPDPADLASAKGFMLLAALVGDSPVDDNGFDGSFEQISKPSEGAATRLIRERSGLIALCFLEIRTHAKQTKFTQSCSIAAPPGVTFRGRDAIDCLCRFVC